jgi:hypothetical protein
LIINPGQASLLFISGAMERLHGSSLSPEEVLAFAEEWYWVCDDIFQWSKNDGLVKTPIYFAVGFEC